MKEERCEDIRNSFCQGEQSAQEIVHRYLGRIEEQDKNLGAYLRLLSDRALKKAEALDKKRAEGKPLGKLAAVPVAIKDNINIKGEITSCGSKFLEGHRSLFDATVIRLLEEEDAIPIGKTNLDEFAMGSSTENSALQETCNPWNLNYVPGGSSGGSATAVAARMAPLALGSDTGGSVRQPAGFCGIVGMKPTYGRISRYGLVAFGSSLDQIGPFATTTRDIALTMEVLGKHCQMDSTSLSKPTEDYLTTLDAFDPPSCTVGVPWSLIEDASDDVKENFNEAIKTLKGMGTKVIDIDMNTLQYSIATYYIIATAEASTNLARFDGIRYGRRSERAKTLEEVYRISKEEGFGAEVKRRILLGTFVLSSGYKDAYYLKALKVRTLIIEDFNRVFKQCDFICYPATPTAPFKKGEIIDPLQMYLSDVYTIPANLAGLPAISTPSGFTNDGLPLGLQVTAPQFQDKKLCQFAYAFEQATDHIKQPPLHQKK
ncbi:Asp-tRNA(Asn)/Glu-tRNA(Gln) amidotransferase subunit GatA [Simkania negevensis]|uniref:Glutamyl-tRNA(Gln) amidotransferase subunit A n=1 Tax=Simkania negevensis TaxID=83561 RepID=A0ABS3APB8_9BACT|nr:Asp-tRNA(Asn)/Glu-tRNA(Gln) amidotransferase subunit GatA [Simkania negevensis]